MSTSNTAIAVTPQQILNKELMVQVKQKARELGLNPYVPIWDQSRRVWIFTK